MADPTRPRLVQWLLDTRPLWPVQKASAKDEVQQLKTVVSLLLCLAVLFVYHDLYSQPQASRALSLLTPAEQDSVLRYYHLRDAKTKLASHLLKHLVIHSLGVPWQLTALSRGEKGKPIFAPSVDHENIILDFNVSHQAGIVCLIAVVGVRGAEVGTDIVCVNERIKQDSEYILKHGFEDWVDIHADVLADSEVEFMKSSIPARSPDLDINAKLRRFYAVWCLREAYVKMTGDALLAPWLKDLEMRDVQVPEAKEGTGSQSLEQGEVVRQFANYLNGKAVTDVKTELTALGAHYMVAGSVRVPREGGDKEMASGLKLGKWLELDLERDVLQVAEASS